MTVGVGQVEESLAHAASRGAVSSTVAGCDQGVRAIKHAKMSAAFNIVELVMNRAGVTLLFRYGMPYRLRTGGHQVRALMGADQTTIKAQQRYDRWGS